MKERIRTVMEQAGLSQQDFAARLGISPASLSSIFTGRTNPTNNHVMAVHRAFPEININWLMFGEGDMIVNSSAEESETGDTSNAADDGLNLGALSASALANEHADMQQKADPYAANYGAMSAPMQKSAAVGRREAVSMSGVSALRMENAKFVDNNPRKIKEIRVFFDDGTYESFVPSNK